MLEANFKVHKKEKSKFIHGEPTKGELLYDHTFNLEDKNKDVSLSKGKEKKNNALIRRTKDLLASQYGTDNGKAILSVTFKAT